MQHLPVARSNRLLEDRRPADPETTDGAQEFEALVKDHYANLHGFAASLTGSVDRASDLTQETFHIWAVKCGAMRDRTKAKSWLFTTLYREFLMSKRRQASLRHYELGTLEHELPAAPSQPYFDSDALQARGALSRVSQTYQTPLVLFYFKDFQYKEIAEFLGLPIGTVKSRIARGIAELRSLLK